jgi:hypothetical protein
MNELIDRAKTRSEPATTPGRLSGRVTRQSAPRKLQPMLRAACSSSTSTCATTP